MVHPPELWLIPWYTNCVLSSCLQLLTVMFVKCLWICLHLQPQIRSAGHLKELSGYSWIGGACSRIVPEKRNVEYAMYHNPHVVGRKTLSP